MTQTFVTVRDTTLEVEFSYNKGYPGSLVEPPEEAGFIIENVMVKGEEIYELLDDPILIEIEEALADEGHERLLEYQISKYEDSRL